MSGHSTNSDEIQFLYEGDQSKLYSGLMSHHHGESVKSEGSKKQIGRIKKVTLWLTIITIAEVGLGLVGASLGWPHSIFVAIFLVLTLLKAAYIVKVFMHLGDEVKGMILLVLIPLTLFIWFIIAFLADGGFWLHMNNTSGLR